MARQWRCAVVGTGMVGEWHVRTIPKIANAQLVAIAELRPERARAVLEKNKLAPIPIYESLAEML
jgi:predicted dehydrogenase